MLVVVVVEVALRVRITVRTVQEVVVEPILAVEAVVLAATLVPPAVHTVVVE